MIPALCALTLALAAGTVAHLDDADPMEAVRVRWQGKSYKGSELPEELGPGPPAAVEAWAAWTLERGYQLHLVPDGRLLLVSPKKNGKLKRQLALIAQTQELFDELVPEPEREEVVVAEEAGAEPEPAESDELPEDPEGGPVGWQPEGLEPVPFTYSYEWGAGTWPPDTETCVLFVVHDEEDYGSLVDALGEMQDYLKDWAKTGKQNTGFVHEHPLVAAYIENASGQEEWDPDNEVVHRTAQMLFVRRFSSQQPYWLAQGFSWHVEYAIRKAIYCFPYRDEFVFAVEHTAWGTELKNAFSDRKKDPLRLEEFAGWKRGKYDGRIAKISWGLVGHMTEHHPGELSRFAEALRLFALEDNRIEMGDGSWERDPDYVVSIENQGKLLSEHFGEEFLSEATKAFGK